MVYKQIINDKEGSVGGSIFILLPFIICVMLVAVSIPIESENAQGNIEGLDIYIPENYEDMTKQERINYLAQQHGGMPTEKRIWWEWGWDLDFFYEDYMIFPDHTKWSEEKYDKWINGQAKDVDVLGVAFNILTLNPPILEHLNEWGMLIRIILIASVAIGMLDLLWIG